MDHFSRALHLEYSSRGIFVQSLIPFQVKKKQKLNVMFTRNICKKLINI